MNPSEQGPGAQQSVNAERAVWPPSPTNQAPVVPESDIAMQKALDTAQKYFAMGWIFYPLYIVAMVYGLKANRLGANGRGTKYVVAGSLYLVFVVGLLLFIAYTILTHHRP